jgi:hypothetical protein
MRAFARFCQFYSDARRLRRITKPMGRTFDLQDHRVRAAVRQALKNVAYASSARPRGSAGPIRRADLKAGSATALIIFDPFQ